MSTAINLRPTPPPTIPLHDTDEIKWNITPEMIMDPHIVYSLIGDGHIIGRARVHLTDAKIIMPIRDAIFHLMLWRIYHSFDIPITTDMTYPRTTLHSSALAKLLTTVMYDIRRRQPLATREKICKALFEFMNYLYNFIVSELNAYACTMDMVGLAKLMNHKDIKPIISLKYNKTMGTRVVEKTIAEANLQLQKVLMDRNIIPPEDNVLLPYLETKEINLTQLPQMMISYGPRTDVDDTIILKPIMANTIDGLQNVVDYAIESLSAKKSAFYNSVAIRKSQYFGRKQHLLTASITTIHPGDCGSNVLVSFLVTQDNYHNLTGINIVEKGVTYPLTEEIAKTKINQHIAIRNPLTCRHTTGVCEACGGELFFNIAKGVNVGILAAIAVISETTQKILSAKHLIKTSSMYYELPHPASEYMYRINANEIQWQPSQYKHLEHMEMGIPLRDMGNLHDITLLNLDDDKIREERFSKLTRVVLRNTKTDKTIELPLAVDKTKPFFTIDMLRHIRSYLQKGGHIGSDVFWIPLAGTNKFSIMKALVINDNMLLFVNSVSGFLSKGIASYTSVNKALNDFCDTVYAKVASAHVTHISTILKAYMVSSDTDYRIPRVEDPDKVKFKTTSSIISHRAVSSLLGFQNIYGNLSLPSSYLVPKCSHPLDPLFNINPD